MLFLEFLQPLAYKIINSTMYSMRTPITQEDEMGCGAACVAFVANISYKEAAEILGSAQAKTSGYRLKKLVTGLSTLGLT